MSAYGTSRHSRRCNIPGRYWDNNGHWSALALNGLVASDPSATLARLKYCTAAVYCLVKKCYPRAKRLKRGVIMKLPRRKFLHLAAGAAALPCRALRIAQTYLRIV